MFYLYIVNNLEDISFITYNSEDFMSIKQM